MRSALRWLCRRPAFGAIAILTLALGIGANTALFGVIYAVLIRPLPFREPARLVQVWESHPSLPQLQVTVPDFEDWRKQARSFEQMAAYTLSAMNTGTLLGVGDPEVVHATMAGAELFRAMGIRPLQGRVFSAEEERTQQKVAVLSEALWRRRFGADPGVVGRQIRLDQQSFRVVGVTPQRQAYPDWADMWLPLSLIDPQLRTSRKFHTLEVIGRLRSGVTPGQANGEMQAIARRLAGAYPQSNGTVGAFVTPLQEEVTRAVRPSLLLAWAAVGLILLMACANVAHLFLARIIERRQEMRIREALGASAGQLMLQVLSEGLTVAAIGGAAGFAGAAWMGRLVKEFAGSRLPQVEWTGLETPVWLFAAAAALTGGVLLGLPACWHVMRSRRMVPDAGRTVAGGSRFSAALVASEVAIAVLVLAGVALLTRNFAALVNEDPGFRAERVWVAPNLPMRRDFTESGPFLANQLIPALLNTPGVTAVAAANSAPLSLAPTEKSRFATRFGLEGKTFDQGSYPVAQNRWVTPNYFALLGIPLRGGRWLTEADRGQPRIVINETLARRYFPQQDAVGKHLILGVMDQQPAAIEIVGVAGDVRELGLDQETPPTIYGITTGPVMTLLVKTAGGGEMAPALRDALRRADPEAPAGRVHPLERSVSESLAQRRFILTLLAIFGAMAALLTAAGIYGLLARSVSARFREFGVRAAVGAAPGELVRMILREALLLALPGLALGVALALAFSRVMESFVYRLSPADPLSIAAAGAFILVLTILSAWLPARRAAAVDPALALHSE